MGGFEVLFEKLFEFIGFFKFWRVIPIHKKGVRLRWGKNPVELKPGLHFIWPFEIDHVKTVIVEQEWYSPQVIHITTSDYKTASFGPTLAYEVIDPIKWFYKANDAYTNLNDAASLSTSEVLTDCSWEECMKKPTWTKIKNKIKDKTENLGIKITEFGLIDLTLSRIIITSLND